MFATGKESGLISTPYLVGVGLALVVPQFTAKFTLRTQSDQLITVSHVESVTKKV